MKTIAKWLTLAMIISVIFFVEMNDSVKLNAPSMVESTVEETKHEIVSHQNHEDNLKAVVDNVSQFTFQEYLEDINDIDRIRYEQLNDRLFGILAFKTKAEYDVLRHHGFPSIDDFEYVNIHDTRDLSNQLYNSINHYPEFSEGGGLSYQALSTLNLLQSLADLEKTVRYYIPEYQQGDKFPRDNDWPEGERPEQVTEQFINIMLSYSVVKDASAFELLAQARYQQFAFNADDNNAKRVVEKLAQANKLLKGNSNLEAYVKSNYAGELANFYELSKNK